MAAVAVSAASPAHHYIRTIHTSFTVAHPNPWAARSSAAHSSPLLSSNHANLPLYASQPLGAAGHHVQHQQPLKYNHQPPSSTSPSPPACGRRRAYAFRAPSVTAPTPRKSYKFDPFADEPTTPVPTLSTLASLSVPPTPKLAPAALPQRRATSPGLYNHQLHQQQRRSVGGGYVAPAPRRQGLDNGNGDIWRGFPSPIPRTRTLSYEIEEYDYEIPSSSSPSLRTTPLTPKPTTPVRASPAPTTTARRSPSPPSTLNPASPVFTPSRPLARTPSPPTPAPPVTYASTKAGMLNDKDAKARLVAGILLNRVHVSKPMRRRPVLGSEKRPYVPSGLSNVIACAA
ncbi:hypothetical protein CC1G_04951 [Coprinopsis cinerea okayama7|uniref:Uncharacterized protein n=1 Tax=Coprinopsis cinerea (strain Okayama-7 / 130 / ATCC MYA-4618 / FGSC 9003) TaxID=240176 RepID=A8PFN9_COPC7|nr:hypothetical protein CC1G_04951 [Coprinopsis cinerea okayama7\|eukprot:XP_001841107.2 hypothetical protein CC1G_04951 [Coprinopsis cinerea okayama7\